jgi:serine/threonine protein kinase/Tfp pilus assembly protein PilF
MIGQILGHYRILERIGAGGMGVVFRARDERLERDVAIKVLPAGAVADEAARSRLLGEARIASALNHPHICTIHEVGEADGGLYIVMELVEGQPLGTLIVGDGLPVEAIVRYGTQIADALAHAHARNVIHRDLKGANVVVTAEGHAKVLDFGLAKRLRDKELDDLTLSRDKISEAGSTAGTLPYMAPEVLRGEEADPRTDLWALGIVLYQLASGDHPFRRRTGFEVTSAILREPPAPLPPRVPPGLRDVILRCLAKEPEQRYQSASEVRAALEAIRSQTTALAAEPPLARERIHTRHRLLGLVGAVTVIVIAVFGLNLGGLRHRIFGPVRPSHIRSLAVLPLANLSGDPEQGYFADGMTDALILELSKIRALKVISRTSAMHYRETTKPLPEIARELGVDAVMEGSVLRENDEVQISVELVDGKSDKHLWTEKYQRKLSGILKLQADVARAIAQEIQIDLTQQEQATLTAARPVNPAAHEAYLKGRYFWDKQSVASVRTAIGYFQRALELDPNYAPAYAGLADSYVLLSWVGADPMPASAAYLKAKEVALRALVIDNSLAAAHASLGIVRWRYDWDWEGAEKEFKQALELNPSDATAHHWYGLFLTTMGRHQEAVPHFKQAMALDPLSLLISVNAGWAAYFARDYQRTIEQERATLEFWPDFGPAHYSLGLAYEQVGTFDQAIAEFEKTVALSGRAPYLLAALGHAFARSGKTGQAMRMLNELNQRKNFPPSLAAIIWAGLDKKSQALDWLEKAHADRDPYLVFLKVNPIWDPLRAEPRFVQLLDEVGLKP